MLKVVKILLIILLSFLWQILYAQIDIDSLNSHNAFKVGERLLYTVKYNLIKGGEAYISLDLLPNGEDFVYYAKAEARTTGAARAIAKIYDTYESYFDLYTGYPIRATRTINENHYSYYNDIVFYQDSGYVWSFRSGKRQVPTPILDLLSAYYFARRYLFNQGFEEGQIINLTTYFEDRVFPLKIKFKKKQKIRTKFGRIEALLFVPALDEKDNPFKKEDDLRIWFTNDGNYIPVKLIMKTPFGSVKAELKSFENLNYPFGLPREKLEYFQSSK